MDYIQHKINQKIRFHDSLNNLNDAKIYYQVKIEYLLMFTLAYLWDKNFNNLDIESKIYTVKKVLRPTIGDIVNLIHKLDISKEIFINKKASEIFDRYPKLRNERIGHGYVFEDGLQEYIQVIKEFCSIIFEIDLPIIKQNIDLVYVSYYDGLNYSGINFKGSQLDFIPWVCSNKTANFELKNLYALTNEKYTRLSPFIHLNGEDDFFIYSSLVERLLGKVKYNQINKTGTFHINWPELSALFLIEDENRTISTNGTIVNHFERNYSKYIEIGIKSKILKFLYENKASVCATIWGHGGVGKTASIQSVCDDLLTQEKKIYDYIVFLSAKDRFFNYYTGTIDPIESNVNSYNEIISNINKVMGQSEEVNEDLIVNFEGKLLIIIDDFETFSHEDRTKIEGFIKKLNINNHKVIITTRANIIIGEEVPSSELDHTQTKEFLVEIFNNYYANHTAIISQELTEERVLKIHHATSGRPIFIYQFANILVQKGFVDADIWKELSSQRSAKDFLYGRIYEYLTIDARTLFISISKLIQDDKETNLVDKLKYIVSMEDNEDKFISAFNELVKLRIVEQIDSNMFRIYSKELLVVMNEYFLKRDDTFKGNLISRLNHLSADRKLDVENALLENADAARYSKNEEEVISLYRHILNRSSSPAKTKIKALLNLTSYLTTSKGKHEQAIKVFEDYLHVFNNEKDVVKMYSVNTWAKGYRDKSISILRDFFSRNSKTSYKNIELFGLLLTNRSVFCLNQREDTKEQYRIGNLSYDDYLQQMNEQRQMMQDIFNEQGHILFNHIRTRKFSDYDPGTKQNISTGLYQLIEICIRLSNTDDSKFDYALELCNYGHKNFPAHYTKLINNKINNIKKFRKKVKH